MAFYIYIYIYIYEYVYVYVYMWYSGVDCSYMRLEYEVNETSAAKLRVCHVWWIIYGGFDIYS